MPRERRNVGAHQLLEGVVVRVADRTIVDGPELVRSERVDIAGVEPRARTPQRTAAALRLGLALVVVVDREVVRLAHLDHRREAVGAQIVVRVLPAGQETQRHPAVEKHRPLRAPLLDPLLSVLERSVDLRGHLLDPRHEVIEELVPSPLGLDHRELHLRVLVDEAGLHQLVEVADVVLGDDAVDGEVDAPPGQVAERTEALVEGVRAHHQVVHLRAAPVQREVDVLEAPGDEILDHLGVAQDAPVGHEPKVHVEPRHVLGPLQELGSDRGLTAREHHHAMTERLGALDLLVDLTGLGVDVANVERVAEGAVVVAPVPDLDERLQATSG